MQGTGTRTGNRTDLFSYAHVVLSWLRLVECALYDCRKSEEFISYRGSSVENVYENDSSSQ